MFTCFFCGLLNNIMELIIPKCQGIELFFNLAWESSSISIDSGTLEQKFTSWSTVHFIVKEIEDALVVRWKVQHFVTLNKRHITLRYKFSEVAEYFVILQGWRVVITGTVP